eukprot:6586422-Prymnesium_polylepis.1
MHSQTAQTISKSSRAHGAAHKSHLAVRPPVGATAPTKRPLAETAPATPMSPNNALGSGTAAGGACGGLAPPLHRRATGSCPPLSTAAHEPRAPHTPRHNEAAAPRAAAARPARAVH